MMPGNFAPLAWPDLFVAVCGDGVPAACHFSLLIRKVHSPKKPKHCGDRKRHHPEQSCKTRIIRKQTGQYVLDDRQDQPSLDGYSNNGYEDCDDYINRKFHHLPVLKCAKHTLL